MKKILLSSLVAAAAAMPAFAGVDNINYQAVIKSGNEVVANQAVELKFELLDKAEKVVYTEDQKVQTNAAGYVSCLLGGDDAIQTIEWGDLTLRVSINLGNGFEVISNEEVSSVPTALYALRTADSDEIKEAVEELMIDNESNKTSILGINAALVKYEGFIEDQDAFNTEIVEKVQPMIGLNYEEINDFNDRITTEVIALQEFKESADQNLQDINDELAKLHGLSYDEINDFHERVSEALTNLQNATEELNVNTEAFAEMNETRLDKMQNQIDAADKAIEELNVNTEAFAEMNETRLDKMQNQIDAADKAIEENYDDLKGSIIRNEQSISALQGKVNENFESYQEDWQSLAKFQEEISTDVNEFKDQYAEDWQSLTKFQEEISTDVNEFKNQYAEDWQSLTKFQEEISTDVNEFKADYQESFQKMVEFQEGASNSINQLDNKVALLEDTVKGIVGPDEDSMMMQIGEQMGQLEAELMTQIEALKDQIAALEAEIKALKGEE